jgi:hypothetical protein
MKTCLMVDGRVVFVPDPRDYPIRKQEKLDRPNPKDDPSSLKDVKSSE